MHNRSPSKKRKSPARGRSSTRSRGRKNDNRRASEVEFDRAHAGADSVGRRIGLDASSRKNVDDDDADVDVTGHNWHHGVDHAQLVSLCGTAGVRARATRSNASLRSLDRRELVAGCNAVANILEFAPRDMRDLCVSRALNQGRTPEERQAILQACILNKTSTYARAEDGEDADAGSASDASAASTVRSAGNSPRRRRTCPAGQVFDEKRGECVPMPSARDSARIDVSGALVASTGVLSMADKEQLLRESGASSSVIAKELRVHKKYLNKMTGLASVDMEKMNAPTQMQNLLIMQNIKKYIAKAYSTIESYASADEEDEEEGEEDGAERGILGKIGGALKWGTKKALKLAWSGILFVGKAAISAISWLVNSPLTMSILTNPKMWWTIMQIVNGLKSTFCHRVMVFLGRTQSVPPKTWKTSLKDKASGAASLITKAAPTALLEGISNGGWDGMWQASGGLFFTGARVASGFLPPIGGKAVEAMLNGAESITSGAVKMATEAAALKAMYSNLLDEFLDFLDPTSCIKHVEVIDPTLDPV